MGFPWRFLYRPTASERISSTYAVVHHRWHATQGVPPSGERASVYRILERSNEQDGNARQTLCPRRQGATSTYTVATRANQSRTDKLRSVFYASR